MPNVVILPIRFVFSGDTHEGSRCARGSPSSASPERPTCRPTCPSVPHVPRPAEPPSGRQLHDLGRALRRIVASRRRHVPVRQAIRMTGIDLLKVSSHAVELGNEVLVIVAPGGRPFASRRDELAVPFELVVGDRDVVRTVLQSGVVRRRLALLEGTPPEERPGRPRRAKRPSSRGLPVPLPDWAPRLRCRAQRGNVQRAQRAAAPDGQGEAGYHISRPPCALPEVVQLGRGPDAR